MNLLEPIAQDPAYYNFADARVLFDIPNFWNVISNLPFLFVGFYGWRLCESRAVFPVQSERWPYETFFIGVLLTAFGSAYFHWNPSTATLLWDRLPMAVLFMGFVCGVVSDYLTPGFGRDWLAPLALLGVASVVWWFFSEARGAGDLRPYGLVQFGPMVILPVVMLVRSSRYTHSGWLWAASLFYVLAKVCEHFDARVFSVGGFLSGHTIKHFLTALAVLCVARMLSLRHRVI